MTQLHKSILVLVGSGGRLFFKSFKDIRNDSFNRDRLEAHSKLLSRMLIVLISFIVLYGSTTAILQNEYTEIKSIFVFAAILYIFYILNKLSYYKTTVHFSIIFFSGIVFYFSISGHNINSLYLLSFPVLISMIYLTLVEIGFYFIVINLLILFTCFIFYDDPHLYIPIMSFFIPFSIFLLMFNDFRESQQIKREKRLKEIIDISITALAFQAEQRDHETGLHLTRTMRYTKILAECYADRYSMSDYMTESYIEDLCKVSILHDIGKVGISDSILLKPGKLTESEFYEIKKHPMYGAETLKKARRNLPNQDFFELAINIVLYHHERWDGSGYPSGKKGEDIPLSARLLAIADVYDALRSQRPYKRALEHAECVEIIKFSSNSHFDPKIVECFLYLEKEFEVISNTYYEDLFL